MLVSRLTSEWLNDCAESYNLVDSARWYVLPARIYLPRSSMREGTLQLLKRIRGERSPQTLSFIAIFIRGVEVQHERRFLARVCTRLSLAGVASRKAEARLKLGSWLKYLGGLPRFPPPPPTPLPPHVSPLPLFSPILFDRFPTFRKVAALIKRKTNSPTVEIQWSCLSPPPPPPKVTRHIWEKEAIVRLAFRSSYFLAGRLGTFRFLGVFPRPFGNSDNFFGTLLPHRKRVYARFRYFERHIFKSRLITFPTN